MCNCNKDGPRITRENATIAGSCIDNDILDWLDDNVEIFSSPDSALATLNNDSDNSGKIYKYNKRENTVYVCHFPMNSPMVWNEYGHFIEKPLNTF